MRVAAGMVRRHEVHPTAAAAAPHRLCFTELRRHTTASAMDVALAAAAAVEVDVDVDVEGAMEVAVAVAASSVSQCQFLPPLRRL